MRKNKRYSANELVHFIDLYLISGISYKDLIGYYGLKLDNKTFHDYLSRFRVYGPAALASKETNNTYSSEFKNRIIKEYLKNKISYRELAIKYQMPSNSTVRIWVLKDTNGKENRSYSPKSEVYSMKSRQTTLEEPVKIAIDYLKNHLTYKEAAKKT